ncbi:MAG: rhodanese-like domain-containing protein [Luteolibacter sp.]
MKYLLLFFSASLAFANPLLEKTDDMISGSVPLVSIETLAIEVKNGKAPVLLDTREWEEYKVSHIPGAVWVGYKTFDIKRLGNLENGSGIIVYCSIGYRSEKIGERMQAAGFQNVRNLRGGVFAWANDKLPLENENGRTKTVHGYNKAWSNYLDPAVPKKLD